MQELDRVRLRKPQDPGSNRRSQTGTGRVDRTAPLHGRGNRSRFAEAFFRGFVTEVLATVRSEGCHGLTDADLLSELLAYFKQGGKRLRVRVSSGRLNVQRAFDCENPTKSYPLIEPPEPDDANLPIFPSSDFSYIDGLAYDFRGKADELGLPWNVAVQICEQLRDHSEICETKATATSTADKLHSSLVLTVEEAAKYLKVSRATVYRRLEEGKLTRPDLGKAPGKRGKALVLSQSVVNLLKESSD